MKNPLDRRSSGVLLHITSLPGPHGIGDLGPAAYAFVDFLRSGGQRLWQMLPVTPPGKANSPYDSGSAFAGSEWMISLDRLVEDGLLETEEIRPDRKFSTQRVEHARVIRFKESKLRLAFERFDQGKGRSGIRSKTYKTFLRKERDWLEDYALYRALERRHRGKIWADWPDPIRRRQKRALATATAELEPEIHYHRFTQYQFDRQWNALRSYANRHGVALIGDIPIYIAYKSADVWANQKSFDLDARGRQRTQAGVPPDYFNRNGQLWKNPLYNWKALRRDRYDWWIERFRSCLRRFDAVRLDHFIGFHRAWAVSARARTARKGTWVPGPGVELFKQVKRRLGDIPIIAEDLGLVIPEVEALRDRFGFPGMRILQFAWGGDHEENGFLPHKYSRHTVVYTGTHDNDTVIGWFRQRTPNSERRFKADIERDRSFALDYLGSNGREFHWDMIRAALASVADTAIFPLQDILGLGRDARMNRPGTTWGNWRWRVRSASMMSDRVARRLRELTETYGRA